MVVLIIGFGDDDVLIKIIGSWKIGLGVIGREEFGVD